MVGHKWLCLDIVQFTAPGSAEISLDPLNDGSHGLGYTHAGRVLVGEGIGAISAVSPAYVSEYVPKQVRGCTTGFFQITAAFGVTMTYFDNCKHVFFKIYL